MAKDKTEAELRASLRRLVNGESRKCIPANFDYDDDLILDIAISELIALRAALAFAATQIKAGLPWTPQAEEMIAPLLKGDG